MRRLIEVEFNRVVNELIAQHFSVFGSTQMPALMEKLESIKADLSQNSVQNALWLDFGGKEAFDGLGVDDVVFLTAILHSLNESSLNEVYRSLDLNMDELFHVFGASGQIKIKNVNDLILTNSDFERQAFRAMTYQAPVISTETENLIFQGVSPLAGFVSSGADEHFIYDYLSQAESQGLVGVEHQRKLQTLGWLAAHCSDLENLPNENAAHFLRASGVLHPNILRKETVATCFWEDLVYRLTQSFGSGSADHLTAQKIFKTLANDEFFELHRQAVTGMLDNLFIQARYEEVDEQRAFHWLGNCFSDSKGRDLIYRPHFVLNMARRALNVGFFKHVTEPVSFETLELASPSMATMLTPFRADLFNQVLESQLHIEDQYFGIAPLVCPFGVRQIDDGDFRKKPDPDLLKRYLIKTVPIAAHFTRSVPQSNMERDGMCEAVFNTYRYLVDEALKIKKFDWSFESAMAEDQRVFLVKAGLPMSKLEQSTGAMREAAMGVDLGL